jgi:hypothetical protein
MFPLVKPRGRRARKNPSVEVFQQNLAEALHEMRLFRPGTRFAYAADALAVSGNRALWEAVARRGKTYERLRDLPGLQGFQAQADESGRVIFYKPDGPSWRRANAIEAPRGKFVQIPYILRAFPSNELYLIFGGASGDPVDDMVATSGGGHHHRQARQHARRQAGEAYEARRAADRLNQRVQLRVPDQARLRKPVQASLLASVACVLGPLSARAAYARLLDRTVTLRRRQPITLGPNFGGSDSRRV